MDSISLKEVVLKMNERLPNGKLKPFSVIVASYGSNSQGEAKWYNNATLLEKEGISIESKQLESVMPNGKKNPNHWANFTKNINTVNGIRKIHMRLITHFNGTKVHW